METIIDGCISPGEFVQVTLAVLAGFLAGLAIARAVRTHYLRKVCPHARTFACPIVMESTTLKAGVPRG